MQEEIVPVEGLHEFSYFAYGDPEDVVNVQFVYHVFSKRIEELIEKKCPGRGPLYVDSYAEGVVEAVKSNIYWEGIDIPEINPDQKTEQKEKILEPGENKLSKPKTEKEKPANQSVDVGNNSKPLDINAYWRGMSDGSKLHLQDALELEAENKRIKELE